MKTKVKNQETVLYVLYYYNSLSDINNHYFIISYKNKIFSVFLLTFPETRDIIIKS